MTITMQTNRIDQAFSDNSRELLNVYFTAGYPNIDDTASILEYLSSAGADIIEIGMPFSDPVADGPTIQESNMQALDNGMTISLLFKQLEGIRNKVDVPIVLMGYVNPVVQYGIEAFCEKCQEVGVDGLILPDLPMHDYLKNFKQIFDSYGLYNIFLITPQTSEARIKEIDDNSAGFIYMVSSASITGAKKGISEDQERYFNRVNALGLRNPRMIGFGISNRATFLKACEYANGAIIGSAFINLLKDSNDLKGDITRFIQDIKGINN
ncbi:MAG: tryptophan synthase subunit alpha [bacterium]|nr:tryptophan synthase subunit alpha [bacterium]